MKPISPDEAAARKNQEFPAEVIAAVNDLIVKSYWNGVAIVKQEDIILEIANRMKVKVVDGKLLNFEDVYRAHGWTVEYDKPGIGDSYPAFFRFSR